MFYRRLTMKLFADKRHLVKWTRAAIIRAIRTFAQSLLGVITVAPKLGFADIGWSGALSIAGVAALTSILTSFVDLPEGLPENVKGGK